MKSSDTLPKAIVLVALLGLSSQSALAAHHSRRFFPERSAPLLDERMEHGIVYDSNLLLGRPVLDDADMIPMASPSMEPFPVGTDGQSDPTEELSLDLERVSEGPSYMPDTEFDVQEFAQVLLPLEDEISSPGPSDALEFEDSDNDLPIASEIPDVGPEMSTSPPSDMPDFDDSEAPELLPVELEMPTPEFSALPMFPESDDDTQEGPRNMPPAQLDESLCSVPPPTVPGPKATILVYNSADHIMFVEAMDEVGRSTGVPISVEPGHITPLRSMPMETWMVTDGCYKCLGVFNGLNAEVELKAEPCSMET